MREESKRQVGFELRTLSVLIRRHIDRSASRLEAEMTGINGWVIVYLAHNSHRDVFQRDIEENFSVRRSTVSNILALMEKKELISRESVESDGRLKKITLTERGQNLVEMMERDRLETEHTLTQGISEDELSVFFSVTEKMRRNLEMCDGELREDEMKCINGRKKV